jgi:TonB family protein
LHGNSIQVKRSPVRIALACAALVAAGLSSGVTRAQQLPAAEAPTLVPPRVRVNASAEYPPQALRDRVASRVTVALVLEIDVEGRVRRATVTEPQGHGFDEAAVAAAEKLEFEPARRDGTPVAARIRFQSTFDPPSPHLVGRVTRRASNAPIAGVTVAVRDATGADHTATTAPDGTWSVQGLPAGRAHVRVTADGRHPAEEADVDLAYGEETSVVLRPASDGTRPRRQAIRRSKRSGWAVSAQRAR